MLQYLEVMSVQMHRMRPGGMIAELEDDRPAALDAEHRRIGISQVHDLVECPHFAEQVKPGHFELLAAEVSL